MRKEKEKEQDEVCVCDVVDDGHDADEDDTELESLLTLYCRLF